MGMMIAVLASILLLGTVQVAGDDEKACLDALDVFRAGLRSASPAARAQAAMELARHKCPKAVAGLASLLTADVDSVRIAAAKSLGSFDDPKAVDAVAGAVAVNAQRHEVLEAMAKALEDLDWEAGALQLNPLLAKHHDKDILETLHVVVPVLGKLGSMSSVEPLITLLEHAESEGKRVRAAGIRAAGNPKMAALETPIRKALQDITGGSQGTGDKWDDWWKANRDRLVAGATLTYRCKASGKRWGQKGSEVQECPFHDKQAKDGQVISVRLSSKSKP